MKEEKKSRRSFFLKAIGLSAAAAVTAWFGFSSKKKTEKVKMLTQDGRLIEIDKILLQSGGKKISNEEIHSWVSNKTSKTKIK
jgi:hypothetical protein